MDYLFSNKILALCLCCLAMNAHHGAPTAAAEEPLKNISSKTVKQAVDLLKASFACPIKNDVAAEYNLHSEYSFVGNAHEFGVRLSTIEKDVDPNVDVTKLESWEAVGSVTPVCSAPNKLDHSELEFSAVASLAGRSGRHEGIEVHGRPEGVHPEAGR
jgi:hypothetical protein